MSHYKIKLVCVAAQSFKRILYKISKTQLIKVNKRNVVIRIQNMIIHTEDLIKELKKHPDTYICVGKSGDELGRYDQRIISTEIREGNVLILNIENYKDDNLLKYYKT